MGIETQTGGRPATSGQIDGRYSLSVGMPEKPAPEGWRWRLLTDLARLETGHTPSRKHPEYWDGDIPWVGIKDATSNHGLKITDTYQHASQLGIDNSSARVLPPTPSAFPEQHPLDMWWPRSPNGDKSGFRELGMWKRNRL